MASRHKAAVKDAVMLIADISGYTDFIVMKKVSIIHAEEIITELLEAITGSALFPLKLNKIEGDAVFFCADAQGQRGPAVNDVVTQAVKLMAAFVEKQKFLVEHGDGGCPCSACRSAGQLGLKVLVHSSEILIKAVAGREELAGEGVILIHRLLKNSVTAKDYLLITGETDALLENAPFAHRQELVEKIDGFGQVKVVAYINREAGVPAAKSPPFSRLTGIREALRLFRAHRRSRKSRIAAGEGDMAGG